MKKKTMEQAPNNIILEDKEMEVLIRQLVKEAGNKGFGITKLNQAVTTIWKEEFVVEEKKLEPLTEEEENFSQKVKKFLEHYGVDFCKLSRGLIIEKDDLKRTRYLLEKYYKILCSIYGVFQREERINQNKIVRFLKQHFDYRRNGISAELRELNDFFYNHLYFSDDTELPVYTENIVCGLHDINRNEEFRDFRSQFCCRNTRTNNVAIATVWFIKKYF